MKTIRKFYSTRDFQQNKDLISIRNRAKIKELATDLENIDRASQFCLYVKTPFHDPLHITTADHWSITYNRYGFSCVDLSCDPVKGFATAADDRYFIREKTLSADQIYLYTNMEANHINETVSVVRRCKEAYIVGVFHHNEAIDNPRSFYEKNKDNLEEFMNHFFSGLTDIINNEHPVFANTKFMTNKQYRTKVIRNNEPIRALAPQEKQIIRLLASGVLLKEIASIMHVSEKTIRNYIEHTHKKLGTNTITQTIIAAYNLGLI